MNDAIKRYEKADAEKRAAETAMREAVTPYLRKAVREKDTTILYRLVDIIPECNIKRRVYQAILELDP